MLKSIPQQGRWHEDYNSLGFTATFTARQFIIDNPSLISYTASKYDCCIHILVFVFQLLLQTKEKMTYYNPVKWIAPDDKLIPEVEQRVMLEKHARSRERTSRSSFLPPWEMELSITIAETAEALRMTEWIDKLGRVFIDLTHDSKTLRKGHFNQIRWHHNPDGRDISPPHHVHFPTVKYPDLDSDHLSSYAHPINTEEPRANYLTALRSFCDCVNIRIQGVSLPLLRP